MLKEETICAEMLFSCAGVSSFRKDSAFTTWMYRVALNTALMYSRKEKREPRFLPIDDVPASEVREKSTRMMKECERCTNAFRNCQYWTADRAVAPRERTSEEIAEIIGVSRVMWAYAWYALRASPTRA